MSLDLPSIDDLVGDLRAKVKRLHRMNGEPSTRELARRTGGAITHTTVHAVLRCIRLPRWGPLELVVEALGGEQSEFRQLWVAIRDAMDVVSAASAQSGLANSGSRHIAQSEDVDKKTEDRAISVALRDSALAVVATMLKATPEQVPMDADGDINIRSGSAMVFVRVRDNPPLVEVFSPVLTEVASTEKLYAKLSEVTNRLSIGRIYYADSTVWASIPVFGRNFQAVHLMLAVQVMTGLADELGHRLHGEFGGKAFFQ